VNEPAGGGGSGEVGPVEEPKQRWRLTFRRRPTIEPTERAEGGSAASAWDQALAASSLPLCHTPGSIRLRLAFAAPLAPTVEGEAELVDFWLTERLPAWRVREAVGATVPSGHELVSIEDVWLGAAALPACVVGAVYRITLAGSPDSEALREATARLLAAEELPRERLKAGAVRTVDLRPLLEDVGVADSGPPVIVQLTTRHHPERGAGRPDDVMAALADASGQPVEAAEVVRERILLAGDA
jgi:radical SAM-linked protein